MSETQDLATPRPWRADGWCFEGANRDLIGSVFNGVDGVPHDANLDFLLRAVNAHDALVAACEAALDWFDETTSPCEPGCDCTHDMLREALRLARGGAE